MSSPFQSDPILTGPFEGVERSTRDQRSLLWTLTLFGPFVVTAVLLVVIWLVAGPAYAKKLIFMAVMALCLFGRFIILGGSDPGVAEITGSISSLELFLMVFYLDMAVATVLAFHLGFLFKLPLIGPKLQTLIVDGRFILSRQPWIRRATFLGLVMFVTFPLAATGSVGGSIFGRLLGLSRVATLVGILLGSLIGNGVMLAASDFIGAHLNKGHPLVKYGGFAVILAVVLLLESRYRRMRQQFARTETPDEIDGEGKTTDDHDPQYHRA